MVISEFIGCFVVLGFNQAIFMWLKDFPKFDLVVYVLLIVKALVLRLILMIIFESFLADMAGRISQSLTLARDI